jgi:hypothetical protein
MKNGTGPIAIGFAHGVLTQVGLALLFSITVGVLWSRLLHVLSEQRFWQVLTFFTCWCSTPEWKRLAPTG